MADTVVGSSVDLSDETNGKVHTTIQLFYGLLGLKIILPHFIQISMSTPSPFQIL